MTGVLLGVAALLVAVGFLLLFRANDRRALDDRSAGPRRVRPGHRHR